jgi:adenylylsulfate kinase-like enzyme
MRLHTAAAFTYWTSLLNLRTIPVVTGTGTRDAAFVSSTISSERRRISITNDGSTISTGSSFHIMAAAYEEEDGSSLFVTNGETNNIEQEQQRDTDGDNTLAAKQSRTYGPLGHGYLPAADAGPISAFTLSKLTEEQIHYLIARRLQCKKARKYSEADHILSGLVAAGVYLQDKRKEWRADGPSFFGRADISYVRRGGPGPLSEDDLTTVASLVERRAQAKRRKEFHLSDQMGDTLKAKYGVKVNDKKREWSINTHTNTIHHSSGVAVDVAYVPSPIAPKDDPTHTMEEESKAFIQKRLTDRVEARKSKDYAMADSIRDELKEDYSVEIDDRTKEWKVVTNSEEDDFASEAQASQRSAFVSKDSQRSTFVIRDKEKRGLNEELDSIFGADSPVEEDEEREPRSSTTTRTTPTFASSDEAAVPVQQVVVTPGSKERDAMDESSMHLSTLTVVVLKEKLRRAGLPVSGRNKNELIERLLKNSSS